MPLAREQSVPETAAAFNTDRDLPRLTRNLADAQQLLLETTLIADAIRSGGGTTPAAAAAATEITRRLRHLSGEGPFMHAVAAAIGEGDFGRLVDGLTDVRATTLAAFKAKVSAGGGYVPYVTKRLADASSQMEPPPDIVAAIIQRSNTWACVGGVMTLVGGVGTAVFGAKVLGPAAVFVGGMGTAFGATIIAEHC
jgi:hypothetical protein